MSIVKAEELRGMSDEHLALTLKEACDTYFKLKIQAQTERLGAPSELMKKRRLIARVLTIQNQRKRKTEQSAAEQTAAAK
ncbi:MAG: 50S ribosomal protein L29 [Planctomycetia bacterium]|nr:50S ribosomal protein L29 [Planctomycetia bacterium]